MTAKHSIWWEQDPKTGATFETYIDVFEDDATYLTVEGAAFETTAKPGAPSKVTIRIPSALTKQIAHSLLQERPQSAD